MHSILIVDDDKVIRDGIIQILFDHLTFEFTCYEASDGLNALNTIVEFQPELIISDIKMKEYDGLWMLEILKQNHISCNAIMLSGYDDYNLIRNSLKYGAIDYLLKPVNIKNLIDLVNEHFSRPATDYNISELKNNLNQYNLTGTQKTSQFFDLPSCSPGSRDMIQKLLQQAATSASSGNAEETVQLFYAVFEKCSPDILTEEEVRTILTEWVYDLMQKNNMYIKIISRYKLTPYDLANTLKMLPTLSQIRTRFTENLRLHIQEYCQELNRKDEYTIQLAKEFITCHCSENISLQDVAEALYLHPNYFSTLFSKKTHTTFRDYLCLVRIEKAKTYMENPNLRIAEIALMVGYNDLSHFNRAFKRITSMSPSQYRKHMSIS